MTNLECPLFSRKVKLIRSEPDQFEQNSIVCCPRFQVFSATSSLFARRTRQQAYLSTQKGFLHVTLIDKASSVSNVCWTGDNPKALCVPHRKIADAVTNHVTKIQKTLNSIVQQKYYDQC